MYSSSAMYCRLHKTRHVGVRIHDTEAAPACEGVLTVAATGAGLRARLVAPLAMEPIAELYDVRLVAVREGTLVLRGFEQANQQAVLQEWVCTPIDTRHGFDAAGRPLTAPLFPDYPAG
ncbi:MAG: hypothetical protein KDH15_06575 [Rhodocyclaceae bacterium]|nr:hypothetical protein [Rhodocyclaceae bacterium]